MSENMVTVRVCRLCTTTTAATAPAAAAATTTTTLLVPLKNLTFLKSRHANVSPLV